MPNPGTGADPGTGARLRPVASITLAGCSTDPARYDAAIRAVLQFLDG